MFSCLCVLDKNIDLFLNNNGKIFYMDNQRSTPIHYLVKNYYAKPLEKMDINNKIFVKDKDEHKEVLKGSPLEYLVHEYKNHIDKLDGSNLVKAKCFKYDKDDNFLILKKLIIVWNILVQINMMKLKIWF